MFKALASEHRREILRMLSESHARAGQDVLLPPTRCAPASSPIASGCLRPTISHHMSVLRVAGLVDGRKDGLWTYYTLRRDVLEEAAAELCAVSRRSSATGRPEVAEPVSLCLR